MLGFLPNPIGDELLYSILARYRELSASSTSKPTMDAAFGGNGKYAYIGLPGRLRIVAESIPGRTWTAERLAANHTLLPYFERLIPQQVRDRMLSGIFDGWTKGGYDGLSAFLSSVTPHRTLNFCPVCVERDSNDGEMAGWQRVHQLPGVFQCPEHGDPLRTTGVATVNQAKLFACPKEPGAGVAITQLLTGSIAASIAKNSLWLLLNPSLPTDPLSLRAGVRAMLRDANLISESNSMRPGMREAFTEKLGADRLESLRCRIGLLGNRDAWLGWLWEKRPEIRAHPLRYLLLLAFLERDAADLFAFVGQDVPDEPPVIFNRSRPDIQRRNVSARPNIIMKHRRTILAMIAANPNAGRTELRTLNYFPFSYLFRHDPEWLGENLPPKQSKAKLRDWGKIDVSLLSLVNDAISRLRAKLGRPVRITASGIAIEANKKGILLENRDRLPLCTAAADAASEDDVLFARRRLDWAANEMVIRGDRLLWADFSTFGKLSGPWRSALEAHAYDLFDQMVAATTGVAMFPVRGPGWPENTAVPQIPDVSPPASSLPSAEVKCDPFDHARQFEMFPESRAENRRKD